MNRSRLTRRDFLTTAAMGGLAACALPARAADTATEAPADPAATGSQRLSLAQLRKWEALQYGMFIHFASKTPSDGGPWGGMNGIPGADPNLPPYTTSLYQYFQTAQVTELLTQIGPIAEVWIDIPGVLGRGYRTFLYQHIASFLPYRQASARI